MLMIISNFMDVRFVQGYLICFISGYLFVAFKLGKSYSEELCVTTFIFVISLDKVFLCKTVQQNKKFSWKVIYESVQFEEKSCKERISNLFL